MVHRHRNFLLAALTLSACQSDSHGSPDQVDAGNRPSVATTESATIPPPQSETEIIDAWNQARNTYRWLPNISHAGYHAAEVALPIGQAADCNVMTGGARCPGALPRAVGNGVTDDTAAVQAAIDAVGAHGGGSVLLPDRAGGRPRTYRVDGELFIRSSNVILMGASRATTIAFTKSLTSALGYQNRDDDTPKSHTHWAYLGGMLWIGPAAARSAARSNEAFRASQNGWLTGPKTDPNCVELDIAAARGAKAVTTTAPVPSTWTYDDFYFLKLTEKLNTPQPTFSLISRHLAGFDEDETRGFAQTYIADKGEANRTINQPLVWPVRVTSAASSAVKTTFQLEQALRFKTFALGEPESYKAFICKPTNYEVAGAPAYLTEVGVRNLTITMKRDEAWGCGEHNGYKCCNGDTSKDCHGTPDVEHGYDLQEAVPMTVYHQLNFHDIESGWNGLFMERCINCFVDAITVQNADSSLIVAASKFVTVRDVTTGTSPGAPPGFERNHHAFELREAASDVLVHRCRVEQNTRHGLSMTGWNNGNVWSKCTLVHGTLDYHRGTSFDNVRTEITLNNTSGFYGGGPQSGAMMGLRTVHWNIDAQATDPAFAEDGDPGEVSSWLPPKSNELASSARQVGSLYLIAGMNLMPHGALVGVRGTALTGGTKMNYTPDKNLPPVQDTWTYDGLLRSTAAGAAVVLSPGVRPATGNLWVKQYGLVHAGALSPQY